ncbi:ankyrin repeat protein [Colletotrichum truncatum]|uniref:Ankyrin repeat protein n=1 Tax=Colletotrichum truncatum TaxID=5467 RepID=A0ACC3Z903_COLTU
MSKKAWDFDAYRINTGWTMSLNPWATRPDDAPIFRLIADGSWTEILQHMKENHASFWDRREDGSTLLHVKSTHTWQSFTSQRTQS